MASFSGNRRPLLSAHDPGGDLGAGAEAELVQDVLDVAHGGVLGDDELGGDLAVGQAAGHESGDLGLARAERCGGACGGGRRGWSTLRGGSDAGEVKRLHKGERTAAGPGGVEAGGAERNSGAL